MLTGWRFQTMLLGFVLVSCSPTHFEDLKKPVLLWDRSRGLCGSGRALDGDGQLWVDRGGCEDGAVEFSLQGRGAPEKVDALRQAFDALPRKAEVDRSACNGNIDFFSKTATADSFGSAACASGTGSDLSGLEEPYLTAAGRFLALP